MSKRPVIDVYVHEPDIRRRVKLAAAQHHMRIQEWCLQVIVERLAEEELLAPESTATGDVPAMLRALQDRIKARRGGVDLPDLDEQLDETRLEREHELLGLR